MKTPEVKKDEESGGISRAAQMLLLNDADQDVFHSQKENEVCSIHIKNSSQQQLLFPSLYIHITCFPFYLRREKVRQLLLFSVTQASTENI